MPFGTASNRLKQRLFFGLLVKLGDNVCFKCGKLIEKASELSIEHKKDWLDVDPQLFWAEDNIAYSHRKCNKAARRTPKTGRHGTHGLYTLGCRCKPCTDAHVAYNNEWRWQKGLRKKKFGRVGTLASPTVSKTVMPTGIGSSTLPPTASSVSLVHGQVRPS